MFCVSVSVRCCFGKPAHTQEEAQEQAFLAVVAQLRDSAESLEQALLSGTVTRWQAWTIIIRPTFPFFSGPKFELLRESRLGLLSLLCGIILCEPHCQSRFWNPTPLPVRLKFSGFFSGCLCFPCCKGTTTGEEDVAFFGGTEGA